MKFTRTLKRLISLAMVGVLFFAQMAMATYVCPVQTEALAMQATVDMPDCGAMGAVAMDADSPGLCHASCNTAGQSDQTPTLKLPVVALQSLPFVVFPATPVALVGRAVAGSPTPPISASPPLSILHCCFRI